MKKEREAVALLWPRRNRVTLPVTVHLVRLKPSGQELDDDNLRGALKAVRDEVAKQLQVDDGDRELVQFTYSQERGPWGVRIEIRGAP